MVLPAADAWPISDATALDEVAFASQDSPEFEGSSLTWFRAPLGGKFPDMDSHSRGRTFRTANALVRVRVSPEGLPSNQWYEMEGLFSAVKPNAYVLTSARFGTSYELYDVQQARMTRGAFNMRDELECAPEVIQDRARFTSGLPVRLPTKMPDKPRGVLIHLAALMGNEYEAEVMNELIRRGWVVIDVDTQTSVEPQMTPESVSQALAMRHSSDELGKKLPKSSEFKTYEAWSKAMEASPVAKERALVELELANLVRPACNVRSQADIDNAARTMAQQVDETVGENAIVVESTLVVLGQMYPQTRTMPVAIIGFSAGALSTPTVAARIRDRVTAVAIIGGAANVLTTALSSTLTSGGLKVTCNGERPTDDQIEALGAAYLKYSKLDPYHTAPALLGIPVLQVHATWDRWVPAAGGRLLHERLGRPELLEMPGGHGMLFYFLPNRKEWLADWLDRNVPRVQETHAAGG